MATYTISVTLTVDQENAMRAIAIEAGKTIAQIFQQFWDGYTSGGVTMTGAVKAQVDQWISDRVKTKLDTMDSAAALSLLV